MAPTLTGWGPLLALGVVGGLAAMLRWTFSRGGSLVAGPGRPGHEGEYGLLVPVAAPVSTRDGARIVRLLEGGGVRANVADTADGPRVLVFADDAGRARELLGG